MNAERVTISPAKWELIIRTLGLIVRERSRGGETAFPLSQHISSVFGALVKRIRKNDQKEPAQIFTASLKDIEKALAPKKHSNLREKLPKHYHEFLPLFDRNAAD